MTEQPEHTPVEVEPVEPLLSDPASAPEQTHPARVFLTEPAALSFGTHFEVLVGAFHLARVKLEDMVTRSDVARHIQAFFDRPIP